MISQISQIPLPKVVGKEIASRRSHVSKLRSTPRETLIPPVLGLEAEWLAEGDKDQQRCRRHASGSDTSSDSHGRLVSSTSDCGGGAAQAKREQE